jgi:hypothetical protein
LLGIIYALMALVSNPKLLKMRFAGLNEAEWMDQAGNAGMERPIGIEPTPEPWQGSVLPLY